ncbi:hypothetical protein HCN44_004608 [Aphidius gifuensis]|uniref:Fatty acid desaturase domain-containing protein n=1 Tax=Aphidius gifuensis TaxID=684658 RepID=A0A834XZI9_APHGI|nr:acyl-CoA Delta-9 desaturase-like [Aphidius gifuensis]KAF7995136.1 hypothetical protein HCN44_004608 [Aphidius gifuensis]
METEPKIAPTGVLFENEEVDSQEAMKAEKKEEKEKFVRQILWINVVHFTVLHLFAFYGLYLVFTSAKYATTFFAYILFVLGTFGISAGVHRLWSHKAYKAKFPLRVILMIFNSLAYQNSIWVWARDHRVHHKYSETDADPCNAKRGFFFSHVGWLMSKKHPDVTNIGQGVDLKDLEADPVVAFQKKYYFYLVALICIILPAVIPVYFWNETWTNAIFIPVFLRYTIGLNATWLVNSAAHMYGGRPYDKFINPSENFAVILGTLGEGWHNFHHTFPWDYKTSELPHYVFNWTTGFIHVFAKIGWAYDLKSVSEQVVKARCKRTGDGSHEVWGWGDKDQPAEEREAAIIEHAKQN